MRSAWERILTIHASVSERLHEELSRTDEVSVMEYQVLDCLAAVEGSLGMSIIAARCDIPLARLSHVAKRLENRALLKRRPSEELEELRGIAPDHWVLSPPPHFRRVLRWANLRTATAGTSASSASGVVMMPC